jgi:alpha-beta hydrolase superfamily lysophospholipase
MYSNDKAWRKVQAFLPYENRLLSENLPDEVFLQAGNAKIHIDHYPTESPKATIILFHGVGGNGRLLSFIAVPLNRQGYEIICPDLPLYGYTDYTGTISYHHWVDYGVEIAKQFQRPDVPIFLFGLSAGGMLAYQVSYEMESINGVMATCLLDQRNSTVTKKTASNPLVAMAGKPLLKLLHRPLGAMKLPMKAVCNMRAIVNNQELAELLMSDKRSSGANVSIEFLYSMLNPLIKIEACKFDKCPVLLVHPQRDNWTDLSLSQLFFNELRCEKVLKMLDGAGHFPIEPEGLKQLECYCVDFMSKFSR